MNWKSVVIIMLSVCSCIPSDSLTTSYTESDSLGIRIVSNNLAGDNDLPTIRLDAEPVVDVGLVEGPEELRFFRVTDAKLVENDELLVVNAGTQEVRIFNRAGAYLRSFGREGEGPGEFRVPTRAFVWGSDSVAVWDYRLRRMSVFTLDGAFVRHVRPELQAVNPDIVGVFDDGSFLVTDHRMEIPTSGFADADLTFVRYSPNGSFLDSADVYSAGRYGRLDDPGGMVGSPVFSAGAVTTASSERYWVGARLTYEIAAYEPSGRLVQLVRWSGPDRTISSADVEAFWEDRKRGASDESRRRLERMSQGTPVAQQFPSHGRVFHAHGGIIWVQMYRRPTDTGANKYWVFDSEGRLVARAETPETLRVTSIGSDCVVGIELDGLDVEHVRVYHLSER